MPRQKSASSQSQSDFASARNRDAAQTSATTPNVRRWRGVSAGSGWVKSIAEAGEGCHKRFRLSIELPVTFRQLAQRGGGEEAFAVLLEQVVEPRQNVRQTEFVGVAEQASAEWREAGAHDHGQVELRGRGDDFLVEDHGRFVHHREDHPLHHGRRIGGMRRTDVQEFVDRGIGTLTLAGFVEVKTLPVFLSVAAVRVERVDDVRRLHAIAERAAEDLRDFRGDVDADFVEQRHRSHRHPEIDHRFVERLDRVPFLEQKAGFVHVRPEDAIDDETGSVVAVDDGLAQLAREVRDRDHRDVGSLCAADDFDERHAVDGVEEVHAGDVLGMHGLRGDVGDGNGRGVGREDGAGSGSRFKFAEHLALDVDVFDDRLDDELAAFESAPVGGGGDAREFALHLTASHAAAFDLLLPDFRGRFHAAGDRFPVDVAHPDRGVGLVGDELGDAAAHDSRAEDTRLPHLDRRSGDPLLLRLLHHEEEADEVLRDFAPWSDDQRNDGFDFAREAALHAGGHAVGHDLDRGQRRGIVTVCLRQDRFARFAENDFARERVAFDVEFRASAAAALRFRRKLFRDVEQDGGGDNFVDESHALGAFAIERFAVEDNVERGGYSDQPRQARRAAPRGKNPELRFRQSDLRARAVGHDAVIARDGQLAAAAERGAVDRRDGDLRQFGKTVDGLLAETRVLRRLLGGRRFREFGDVRAGNEDRRLAGGNDHAFDVAIIFELFDDRRKLRHHRGRKFVDLLAGKIEPDDGEIGVAFDTERGTGPRGSFSHGGHVSGSFSFAFIGVFVDVHEVDDVFVLFVDHLPLHFERRRDLVLVDAEIARQQSETPNLFLPVEIRVEAIDFGLINLPDFLVTDQFVAIGELHAQRRGIAFQFVEVRDEQRREVFAAVADEHRRADVRRAFQKCFQRLRSDVLAVRVDDDVFLAVGDLQETVLVDLADVAGVEPAVVVDGLPRRIIIVPIPLHDVRPSAQNLAILGDLHFDAGDDFSDRTDASPLRRVDGDDRRGLGEAVAFVNVESGADEECGQSGGERRPAGEAHLHAPAEPRQDFAEDEFVRDERFHR